MRMTARFWTLASLSLLWSCVHALECEKSGFCTLGLVQPWTGDILSGAQMRSVLQARSPNKEIIIASTDRNMLQMSMSLDQDVQALGFGHLLFIASHKDDCDAVMKAMPHTGCAWDSTEQHRAGYGHVELLWNWRWKFLMRATRLGHNVMSIDLDVLIFNDPYVHFKNPPFANITLMTAMEWGPCGINGGFAYAQNAAPDGAVTWMFKEVVERPLRMLDDDMATVKSWSTKTRDQLCMTFDQAWLDDALHSTLRPSPVYRRMTEDCADNAFRERPDVQLLNRLHGNRCENFHRGHTTGADHRQLPRLPERNGYTTGPMRVPNVSESEWHLAYINRTLLPVARGVWSQRLWDQLREDCSACPPWRDEPGQAAAARDVVEHFAFIPAWLFSNFESSGRDGFWAPSLADGSPPLQVLGHVQGFVGAGGPVGKYSMKIMYHPPKDFEAVARTRPSGALYLNLRPVVDRVLALSPAVDLATLARNLTEMHRALGSMIQFATLTNRTIAWPVLSCGAPWLTMPQEHFDAEGKARWREHYPAAPNALPLYLHRGIIPHLDAALFPGTYVCFPATMMGGECAQYGDSLLPVEFRHWRDARGSAALATPRNTIFAPSAELRQQLATLRLNSNDSVAGSSFPVITQADAAAAIEATKDEAVVYMGHPVLIGDGHQAASEEYRRRAKGCRGMYTHWLHGAEGGLLQLVLPGMPMATLAADKATLVLSGSPTT